MAQSLRVMIHQAGDGVCSLTGKEGDGLTVSFEDGTVMQQHLSWKSFRQLIAMKTAQTSAKPAPKPTTPSVVPTALPVAAIGNPANK